MPKDFHEKVGITTRISIANILLVTNALIWYYYVLASLQESVSEIAPEYYTALLIWSIHFAGITVSALAGALLTKQLGRIPFLTFWMILGAASSLTLVVVNPADVSGILMLSLILGVSFGCGMPNCMGYYTDHTMVENRGRLGGIILLISGLGMSLLGIAAVKSMELRALILTVWRIFGLVIFLLIKPSEEIKEKNEEHSYRFIIGQRSFILYLSPWIMFSLGSYLIVPLQFNLLEESSIKFLTVIENAITGIFAIIGGFLLDIIGRKRMAIFGFTVLGLGCSFLGIYPKNIFSWYLYTVVDGIAWGILLVIFVITIWGDLSYGALSDKYYVVGLLPFFVSKFLQLTIGEYIAAIVPSFALFSFIALFLFLAVIPLMYAPETLPEKIMREKEVKSYIEKAKRLKESLTNK